MPNMVVNQLASAADVIDALGGVGAVARLTRTTYRAAHNWKAQGSFPAKTHVVMLDSLNALGLSASPSLWRMVEAAE